MPSPINKNTYFGLADGAEVVAGCVVAFAVGCVVACPNVTEAHTARIARHRHTDRFATELLTLDMTDRSFPQTTEYSYCTRPNVKGDSDLCQFSVDLTT
jgi:hypothetical protein